MSELHEDERKRIELYRELGLEELLTQEPVDEDPLLRVGNDGPRTAAAFLRFFNVRDFPGSPAEGYSQIAANFVRNLESIRGDVVGWKEPISQRYDILLKPQNPSPEVFMKLSDSQQIDYLQADPTLLYEFEETAGTRLFVGALEYFLHASWEEKRQNASGEDVHYYRARYHSPPLYHLGENHATDVNFYLAETEGQDELGRFTSLAIMTRIPSLRLGPAYAKRKPIEAVDIATLDAERKEQSKKLPSVIGKLVPYLTELEKQDPEIFKGIGELSSTVLDSIGQIANLSDEILKKKGNHSISLAVMPLSPSGKLSPMAETLLAATYAVTRASITDSHELPGHRRRHVNYEGVYPVWRDDGAVAVPLLFKETYTIDEQGNQSLEWSARTNYRQQEDAQRRSLDAQPFESGMDTKLHTWRLALRTSIAINYPGSAEEPDYKFSEAA